MSLSDYLLIAGLICAVIGAIAIIRKQRKKGGCCGDCANCGGCH